MIAAALSSRCKRNLTAEVLMVASNVQAVPGLLKQVRHPPTMSCAKAAPTQSRAQDTIPGKVTGREAYTLDLE